MSHQIIFHKEAKAEFDKLKGQLKQEVVNKIAKLRDNPILGKRLGKKTGLDLFGCRSIYFANKKQRIVYEIIKNEIIIHIIAIGKRDKFKAYKTASSRL
jgi:mRNA interferase RelE/StbE